MKAIKLYKKGKLFQEDWKGDGHLYRTNVTEHEQDSFLHSLYYGPEMTKMNPPQCDEWITNKRKNLLYHLSLSKFFVYEHGFIALRRIQYLLKSKHYDLKSLLEDEHFNEQLSDFSMDKKYLTNNDFENICKNELFCNIHYSDKTLRSKLGLILG